MNDTYAKCGNENDADLIQNKTIKIVFAPDSVMICANILIFIIIRICFQHYLPYIANETDKNGTPVYSGITVELINKLSSYLKFKSDKFARERFYGAINL